MIKLTVVIFLFSVVFSTSGFAQAVEGDSLVLKVKNQQLLNNQSNQYPSLKERMSPNKNISIQNESYSSKLDLRQPSTSGNIDMNVSIPQEYVGPTSTYLSNSLNPYTNDYKYYNSIGVTDKSWISTSSVHNTYLTVGSLSKIAASYNYAVSDRIVVSAGSYASKYMLNGVMNDDIGVNAGIKYKVNERVSIHAFGQYSGFANKNGVNNLDRWDMMSNTNYGGAIEYKITDSFGVIGGVNRELNPMTGKWKSVPFLSPVFYNKK